jgi:hypothetical protein
MDAWQERPWTPSSFNRACHALPFFALRAACGRLLPPWPPHAVRPWIRLILEPTPRKTVAARTTRRSASPSTSSTASNTSTGEIHDHADSLENHQYPSIVTENTKFALRVANPRQADRPVGGWPPAVRIVLTPQRPSNYYPFNVRLMMELTSASTSSTATSSARTSSCSRPNPSSRSSWLTSASPGEETLVGMGVRRGEAMDSQSLTLLHPVGEPILKRPYGGRRAAVFYPFGYPTPCAYMRVGQRW